MDHDAHHRHRTIADLLAHRVRTEGHRPLLTWYDDHTGARTELSYATLDNWAAKIANMLAEQFDVRAGDTVGVDLDGHWTSVAVLLACWRIGAGAAPLRAAPAPTGTTPVFCHQRRLAVHGADEVVVVGDGLAAQPTEPVAHRAGLTLLADEVHAYPDDVDAAAAPTSPALVLAGTVLDHAALLGRGAQAGGALGPRARTALAMPLDDPAAATAVVGVLVCGGSLVATRSDDHTPRWDRLRTEQVTVVTGPPEALDAAGAPPAGVALLAVDRYGTPGGGDAS